MDKFTFDGSFKCNVTTSPGERPLLHRSLSVYPTSKRKIHHAYNEFQGDNNERTLYRIGHELVDLALDCKAFHEDDIKFVEELARAGRDVFVYSSVPGSVLQTCPLTRGVRGRPNDGTYTATVGTGTTVFFPRGDTGSEAYLEETDIENYPILANGLQNHSGLFSTVSHELPLGRGLAMLRARKNELENSGFADDGTDVYDWTLEAVGGGAAPAGVDRLNTDGWMGVRSLRIWGTGATGDRWVAPDWDASGIRSKYFHISFGWRTDGELLVEINYNDGGGWGTLLTLDKGCGYYRYYFKNQTLANNISLRFSNNFGTYSEICAPQIIIHDADDMYMYYAYLEGYGEDVCGEITAHQLKYTGEFQAGMWVASPTDDCALVVSGFVQPLIKGTLMDHTHKIFTLHHSVTTKELELHMIKQSTTLGLYLRSNATALCNVEIAHYTYGDTIFIAMVVGWNAGTATKAIYAQIVGDDTLYSASDTGTSNFYTIYDELFIGTDHNGYYGADALFQDVNVWEGTFTPCCAVSSMVGYMADEDNLRFARDALGRLYRIKWDVDKNDKNARRYIGELNCLNTKVL